MKRLNSVAYTILSTLSITGVVLIILAAMATGLNADEPRTAAPTAGETPICGVIDTNTQWTVDNSPYYVTCNVEVAKGVILTVDPGVTVKFNDGTRMLVNGGLQAVGTEAQPITFTSAQSQSAPGDWGRLWFAADHSSSILQYAVIEYAGAFDSNAIHLDGGSLTVCDSTIRHNAAAGVAAFVMPTLLDNVFEDNGGIAIRLLLDSGLAQPGQISGNGGTGNGLNGIFIRGEVDEDLTLGVNEGLPYYIETQLAVSSGRTLTLQAGVVFKLNGGGISVDGTLVSEGTPANEVVFTSFYDDAFGGDTNGDGGASSPAPGDWLRLYASNGGRVDLSHAIIRYAGLADTNALEAEGAMVMVRDSQIEYNLKAGINASDGSLEVTGSQISHNGSDGINFCACTRPASPVFSGNSFENNGEFAISLRTEISISASPTIQNNSGSGNGINGIFLDVLLGTTVLERNPGLPYVVHSIRSEKDSELTITAGTIFKADFGFSASGSKIDLAGILKVEGQPDDPVVFTSLKDDNYGGDTNRDGSASQPAPGDWRGISLTASTQAPPPSGYVVYLPLVVRQVAGSGMSKQGVSPPISSGDGRSASVLSEWTASLDHVIVRYAGYDSGSLELFGGNVQISNTTIRYSASRGIYASDTQLTLTNSTLSHNGMDGLWLYGHDAPIAPVLVDNQIHDNGTFAVYLIFDGGCHPNAKMHGNTAWGNGLVNGIYIEGHVDSPVGVRWGPNPGMPYVVWTVSIPESGRLELEPGVVVKFTGPTLGGVDGVFIISGTLEAVGTVDAPIAFTSFWDDTIGGDTDGRSSPAAPGDWIGFLVTEGGLATLDHTIFRYGGGHGYNIWARGASLQLTNSEISHSADKGLAIQIEQSALPVAVRNNTFSDNGGYAITVWSETPTSASLEFEGNEGQGNGINGILLDATLGTTTVKANPTLPYVLQSVTVAQGSTVTVEPGVVFKGDQEFAQGGSGFVVNGQLQVQGEAATPVVFTSLHDDTVGGDTLGDGGGRQPGRGDWRGISVNSGGVASLVHGTVRYGGYEAAGLFNSGGQVTLDSCRITNNLNFGIGNLPGGTVTVTHSLIRNNSKRGLSNGGIASITYSDVMNNDEYGVYSYASELLTAEYNYWGSADGPSWDGGYCDNPPSGTGDFVTCHSVDYEPFASTPYH